MNKNSYCFVVFTLVMFVGFAGCAKDTRESKLEDARIAMDNRDFNKAISLTEGLLDKDGDGIFDSDKDPMTGDDAEAAHLSASARFGRAGIDLTAMLDLAEKNASAPKPSAIEKTADCIKDADFKVVSDMIPVILTQQHLTDLDLGLKIVDVIISKNLVSNADKLKLENLLKAIGNAARIIVAIIVATDAPPRDNKPDHVPSGTELTDLANKVALSFVNTLDGLAGSGILSSNLLKAINTLRSNITGNPNVDINGTNLSTYLQGLVNQCP